MEEIVIPALDKAAAASVRAGWSSIDKPGKNLGKLEEMVEQVAAITGKAKKCYGADVRRPRHR